MLWNLPNTPRRHTLTRRQFSAAIATAAVAGSACANGDVPPPPAQLAIAGCAHPHLSTFVTAIEKRGSAKIAAVWDPSTSRAEPTARQTGAKIVRNPAEIWQNPSIAGMVVCSETDKHLELVLGAAAAKKHLYVEKPLGISGKDSLAMAAAIEKAGVVFQTGYVFRSESPHLFLRQQIKAGAFGTITHARCCNANGGILAGQFDVGQPSHWMMDPAQSGGGAFNDGGTHALDLLMWLLGDIASVSAAFGKVTHKFATDEFGEATVEFKNGAIGSVAASWVDAANPVTLQIGGTEGSAAIVRHQLYFKSSKVPGADGTKPWTELPPALPQPIDLFLDALEGKKDIPLCSAQEAAERCAVMELIYEAARTGRRISR